MVAILAALCIGRAGGYAPLFDLAEISERGRAMLGFGGLQLGMFGAISLALTQVTGMMGMPHLLIRFFTVPDERAARTSLVIGTTLIGFAMATVLLVIGPAAITFVGAEELLRDPAGGVVGGSNMITMHLARLLGGDLLFGLMCLVSCNGRALSEWAEVAVFRLAAFVTSALGIALAILFQKENITFLILMAQTVAASTTFPLLILAIYWRGLTATAAIAMGLFGLVTSVLAIVAGPAFWVKALGNSEPLIPTDYPALATVPATFVVGWIISRLGTARDQGAARSADP